MTRESLQHMIEQLKATKQEADKYTLDQVFDATVFAQAGSELVTIPRVERIDLRPDYVALYGARGEMVFFPYEHLAGLKVEPRGTPASGATSRTPPGFGAR